MVKALILCGGNFKKIIALAMKVQLQKQCSGYYTSALFSKQHYCCNHKCILLIATHKDTTEITQEASNMSGLSVFCKCTTG